MKKEKVSIKNIGDKIISLEKSCQQGIQVENNLIQMQELIKDLSLEDMLEIDEYITKNILTK